MLVILIKIWSADLMDKSNLSKNNRGYKYLLNVIYLFSKYAYCIPLKSKSQHEVAPAFAKLFKKINLLSYGLIRAANLLINLLKSF